MPDCPSCPPLRAIRKNNLKNNNMKCWKHPHGLLRTDEESNPLFFCDIICPEIQLSRRPRRAAYPSMKCPPPWAEIVNNHLIIIKSNITLTGNYKQAKIIRYRSYPLGHWCHRKESNLRSTVRYTKLPITGFLWQDGTGSRYYFCTSIAAATHAVVLIVYSAIPG